MKKRLNEIFFLRGFACLAIVLVHSLNVAAANYDGILNNFDTYITGILRMAVLFGTPTFIFISAFLLARSYSSHIPQNFIKKRVKIIGIPFILMAIFYAFFEYFKNDLPVGQEVVKNLFLAGYHGYFILVIFQFYFLHLIFQKYIADRFSPRSIIISSLVLNAAYLGFFNFVDPLDIPYAEYIWFRLSWLPFMGWIFYFSVAYYFGKHYDEVKVIILKHAAKITLLTCLTFFIVIVMRYFNLPEISSSKRVDMLFYTVSMILFIILTSLSFKNPPRFLVIISQYSFSIYLLHPFIQLILPVDLSINYWVCVTLTFSISIVGAIVISYIFNKMPFGKYIVGAIGPGLPKKSGSKLRTRTSTALKA